MGISLALLATFIARKPEGGDGGGRGKRAPTGGNRLTVWCVCASAQAATAVASAAAAATTAAVIVVVVVSAGRKVTRE